VLNISIKNTGKVMNNLFDSRSIFLNALTSKSFIIMTKLIISLIVVLTSITSVAQNQVIENDGTANDIAQKCSEVTVYKLFPTENMWTFLKLNTRNGQMWQVQYDVEGDNRLETFLNALPLVSKNHEVNGRFTLHSTQNIYTFILLDQIDGKMWQVQWAIEFENRFILPIL
jgi:hypothetical protein